ncbi:YdcF family protein [Sabulilitoribacter arenilitoris]|uniref:YdcF family protein n=1 Tax=Wocania arenilitoris TaxID=2044858 RepID=A0AAE3ENJ6_9FLAO|nr:YdcF family protein [Wocania arenilitoris]MCF7568715.1 YdcF family protein [Wocania arenilitoris]
MKKNTLIVLGSPNSPEGVLSDISRSRLNYCASLYTKGSFVLCTGGWGDHFNTSSKPHAEYSKAYLIKNGIPKDAFLDFALSSNTVDDAVKIKPVVEKLDNVHLTIITSEYHLERVKLIFNEILNPFELEFVGVKSNLSKDVYNKLVAHEKKAVKSILDNGLYY